MKLREGGAFLRVAVQVGMTLLVVGFAFRARYANGDRAKDSSVLHSTYRRSCERWTTSLRRRMRRKLDTDRIQGALDKCTPGMAVELKPGSGNNAFLTGPLELRTGVTLLVDEGVTLFGSRDAAVYEYKDARRRGFAGRVRRWG